MPKKRKKPKQDPGEEIVTGPPDSSSETSESDYVDSCTVEEKAAEKYAPYRVTDYSRRYPEDAVAGYDFIVFIESTNEEQPIGQRDMMYLSGSFTRFVKGIKYLKKINRYKIGVVFDRPNLANSFLDNVTFLREQSIKASIPAGTTELSGVITSVPTDMSNKKIFKAISSSKKIISVRRIMKKVRVGSSSELQPTQTVVITFASSTSLPDYVHIKMWRLSVLPYIPPVKQCFRCLRFGHLAKFCKNSQRCSVCTEGHSFKECSVPAEKAVCVHCKGNHLSISGQCPIKKRKIAESRNTLKTPFSDLFNKVNFPSPNKSEHSTDIINLMLSNSTALSLLTESIVNLIKLNKTQNESICTQTITSAIRETIKGKNIII